MQAPKVRTGNQPQISDVNRLSALLRNQQRIPRSPTGVNSLVPSNTMWAINNTGIDLGAGMVCGLEDGMYHDSPERAITEGMGLVLREPTAADYRRFAVCAQGIPDGKPGWVHVGGVCVARVEGAESDNSYQRADIVPGAHHLVVTPQGAVEVIDPVAAVSGWCTIRFGSPALSAGQCLVRNDTGSGQAPFTVLGIDDGTLINDPAVAGELLLMKAKRTLAGIVPTQADHIGRFVITQEAIFDGEIGLAVASGISAVQINMSDADHRYADVTNNEEDYLTSHWVGSAEILTVDTGTGVKWGIVRFPILWSAVTAQLISSPTASGAADFKYTEIDSDGTAQLKGGTKTGRVILA